MSEQDNPLIPLVKLSELRLDDIIKYAYRVRYSDRVPEAIIQILPSESFLVVHNMGEGIQFLYDGNTRQIVGFYLEGDAARALFDGKDYDLSRQVV